MDYFFLIILNLYCLLCAPNHLVTRYYNLFNQVIQSSKLYRPNL